MRQKIKTIVRHIITRYFKPVVDDIAPDYWGLSNEAGVLALHGAALVDIAQEFGSPNHVLDSARLGRNAQEFRYGKGNTPLLKAYYSYKTQPVPGVLAQLHEQGIGAEVISDYELWLAMQLGVPPQDIIYNGPAKSDDSLRIAISTGIRSINLNHPEELERVTKIAEELGQAANISLRLVPPNGWAGQFGFDIKSGEAMAGYRRALSVNSLNVIGVHCHRGHLFHGLDELRKHIASVTDFLDELHNTLGFHPQLLDLGGSFAIRSVYPLSSKQARFASAFRLPPPAGTPQTKPESAAYTQCIAEEITSWSVKTGRAIAELAIEPGRALTGDAHFLLVSVIALRKASDGVNYAVLDAGISAASIVRGEFHQVFAVSAMARPNADNRQVYRLVGPICHMGATLSHACLLPELEVGDVLAIMDTGAYCIPEARPFSFIRPGVIEVDAHGNRRVLRAADRFEDLIASDHGWQNVASTKL